MDADTRTAQNVPSKALLRNIVILLLRDVEVLKITMYILCNITGLCVFNPSIIIAKKITDNPPT